MMSSRAEAWPRTTVRGPSGRCGAHTAQARTARKSVSKSDAIEPGGKHALGQRRKHGRVATRLGPQRHDIDAGRRRDLGGVTDKPALQPRRVRFEMELQPQRV